MLTFYVQCIFVEVISKPGFFAAQDVGSITVGLAVTAKLAVGFGENSAGLGGEGEGCSHGDDGASKSQSSLSIFTG